MSTISTRTSTSTRLSCSTRPSSWRMASRTSSCGWPRCCTTSANPRLVGSKRVRALRYSNEVIEDVARLVYLHLRFHGYGGGQWTDSAVRRYVTDAGPLLPRLHKLVRADCTTRNRRKAATLRRSYDELEERV